jgi:hypothetical protein
MVESWDVERHENKTARQLLQLVGMIALLAGLTGCINPVSPEQMSDWRWKQWDPNYQADPPPR